MIRLLPKTIKIKGGKGGRDTPQCVVGRNGETRVYIVDNDEEVLGLTGGGGGGGGGGGNSNGVRGAINGSAHDARSSGVGPRGASSNPPAYIQFSSPDYTVLEHEGEAVITVRPESVRSCHCYLNF